MTMQYLSTLYIWLNNMICRALIWEHEDVASFKRIIANFRNTQFVWLGSVVEVS